MLLTCRRCSPRRQQVTHLGPGYETGDRYERSPEFCGRALGAGVRQTECLKRGRCHSARDAQILILLVSGEGCFGFVAESSVDRAVVISKARKLGLDRDDNSVAVCTRRGIAVVIAIR